ncbi:MAG: efflux RND transporter periplasmic adaptor subunit [Cytophagales bacterium]|nr:efflux RND transporter periplasmic adaptor subunit [Bernardetiaceae bacterium]MDW8203423.1 efflux RND transporter periplasmic adaptor subunit [Cytophagales bacterium]
MNSTSPITLEQTKNRKMTAILKKVIVGLILTSFIAGTIWLVYYFIQRSQKPVIVYRTETPFITDIIKKTVATGAIVPRREVQIKPQVSGVIEALYVEPGQQVKAGQLIAKVRVVQNLAGKNTDLRAINNAENQLETARANFENARIEKQRGEQLFAQKAISQQELTRLQLEYNLRKEALATAERDLAIIQQNALQNSGRISNEVYSTLDGTVLDVPVKAGSSVVERSNFNEGTTIAVIADMNSLIFEGKIDESEVGKIKEGMLLNLTIGAIPDKTFQAQLEYIAPKGKSEEGAVKFDIRAKVLLAPGDYLRAGYSANADIVLDSRRQVLAIKESTLQFGKKDSVFVEVQTADQQFEKRLVKTGLSDGINVEILSGISKTDRLKVPDAKEKQN